MISYDKAKELLKERRADIEGFTEEFYEIYLSDRKKAIENLGDGNAFTEVKKTDFYNLNGAAYCEFQEVVNKTLREYEFVYFTRTKSGLVKEKVTTGRFDSDEEARMVAVQIVDIFGYDAYEVG